MTEERIGGIEVGIGGSTAELEAFLTQVEKMVADAAARIGPMLDFSARGSVSGVGSPSGGGPRTSPADEKLLSAISELTQALQQAPQVVARATPARRGGSDIPFEEAMAAMPAGAYRQAVEQALAKQGRLPASAPAAVVDFTAFAKSLDEAAAGLSALVAALSESAPAVTSTAAASPAGGGGGVRRAPRAAAPAPEGDEGPGEGIAMVESRSLAGQRTRAEWTSRNARRVIPPPSPEFEGQTFTGAINPRGTFTFDPGDDREAEAESVRSREAAAARQSRDATRAQRAFLGPLGSLVSESKRTTRYDNPIPEPLMAQGPQSSTVAPLRSGPMTDVEAAARTRPRGSAPFSTRGQQIDEEAASRFAGSRATRTLPDDDVFSPQQMLRVLGAGNAYQLRSAQIARAEESDQIRKEAEQLTQGRTSRTGASSLAGYVLGGRRGEVEAQTRFSISERDMRSAESYKRVLDDIISRQSFQIETEEGGSREAAQAWERQARNTNTYKQAVTQVGEAEAKRATALKDVQKFTEGAIPAMRNLFAITVGGAAFGLGLEAFNKITELAVAGFSPAIERAVDANTRFSVSNTQVTASLVQQSAALQGNVRGAIDMSAAQAGLSASAQRYAQGALGPETAAKAGTANLSASASMLFAAAGANAVPQGLIGGYGGLFGGSFLGSQMGGGQGFMETLAQNLQSYKTASDRAAPGTVPKSYTEQSPSGTYEIYHGPTPQDVAAADSARSSRSAYIANINSGLTRGAALTGQQATGLSLQPLAAGESGEAFVSAGKQISDEAGRFASDIAGAGYTVKDSFGNIVSSGDRLKAFLEQASTGLSTQDMAAVTQASASQSAYQAQYQIAQQRGTVVGPGVPSASGPAAGPNAASPDMFTGSAFQQQLAQGLPSIMGQIQRTFDRTLSTTNPAQAALGYFSAPPTPVGTGIAPRNAQEQSLVSGSLGQAAATQQTLNAYYERGYSILRDTYNIDQKTLDTMKSTGAQMASVQAGMSNRDAAFQAEQYGYNLMIAKQQMGDISGLAGVNLGYGQSQIGVLERQNLLLGRQSQELSFQLQQRQINFQLAMAGFQVPGQTAAQQAANVKEAQIEASYAQRQLNLQRAQFGNQVQIVDLSNLRSASNMLRQISLLQQGRRVSLLDAADAQRLARLSAQQKVLMADIGAYMTKTDAMVQAADTAMVQLEQSAGRAISSTEQRAIMAAFNVGKAFYTGATGGFLNVSGGASGTSSRDGSHGHASGYLGTTNGLTPLGPGDYAGEAGDETVAILRNPRQITAGGTGGGGSASVTFTGDIHIGSEQDMNTLVRKMVLALGRDAAIRGLRTPN